MYTETEFVLPTTPQGVLTMLEEDFEDFLEGSYGSQVLSRVAHVHDTFIRLVVVSHSLFDVANHKKEMFTINEDGSYTVAISYFCLPDTYLPIKHGVEIKLR